MNPLCKHCGGRTYRWGNRRGWQTLKCLDCGKQFQVAPYEASRPTACSMTNPYCVTCHNVMRTHCQDYRGRQYFACRTCKTHYMASKRERPPLVQDNPGCVACHNLMQKRGFQNGQRYFYCPTCKTYYRGGRPARNQAAQPSATARETRQQQARQLDAALLDLIRAALPAGLPADLREEVMQETAVAALGGEFDLSEMARLVKHCRRKINRLNADRFRFVSLSQPIPNSNGLTYSDVIAG